MNKKFWLALTIVIWIAFAVISGLAYYVNHYMPHGPSYPTGEYICMNDDRGPCGPEYKEDLENVNIPSWAKFFRNDNWLLFWIGLMVAGIFTGYEYKE